MNFNQEPGLVKFLRNLIRAILQTALIAPIVFLMQDGYKIYALLYAVTIATLLFGKPALSIYRAIKSGELVWQPRPRKILMDACGPYYRETLHPVVIPLIGVWVLIGIPAYYLFYNC